MCVCVEREREKEREKEREREKKTREGNATTLCPPLLFSSLLLSL